MAFCGKCGNQIDDNTKFCPQCGASRSESAKTSSPSEHREQTALSENQQSEAKTDLAAKLMALNDTADTSSMFDANDIMQNKAMAILAYLGPLVLIPILACKKLPLCTLPQQPRVDFVNCMYNLEHCLFCYKQHYPCNLLEVIFYFGNYRSCVLCFSDFSRYRHN